MNAGFGEALHERCYGLISLLYDGVKLSKVSVVEARIGIEQMILAVLGIVAKAPIGSFKVDLEHNGLPYTDANQWRPYLDRVCSHSSPLPCRASAYELTDLRRILGLESKHAIPLHID